MELVCLHPPAPFILPPLVSVIFNIVQQFHLMCSNATVAVVTSQFPLLSRVCLWQVMTFFICTGMKIAATLCSDGEVYVMRRRCHLQYMFSKCPLHIFVLCLISDRSVFLGQRFLVVFLPVVVFRNIGRCGEACPPELDVLKIWSLSISQAFKGLWCSFYFLTDSVFLNI